MAVAPRGGVALLAASLLLTTPRVFFILISGWTEPFLVLLLAAAVYCASLRPRLLPVALGLLLATKQYLVLRIPLTALLVPQREPRSGDGDRLWWACSRPRWREWCKLLLVTVAVAAAVTAPLALWDWKRFYFSVVTVQEYAPFRWDALSYLTRHAFGHGPPSEAARVVWPAATSSLALALCLWRAPPHAGRVRGVGRSRLPRVLRVQQTGLRQLLLLRDRRFVLRGRRVLRSGAP